MKYKGMYLPKKKSLVEKRGRPVIWLCCILFLFIFSLMLKTVL